MKNNTDQEREETNLNFNPINRQLLKQISKQSEDVPLTNTSQKDHKI